MNGYFDKVIQKIEKLDVIGRRQQFEALAGELRFFETIFDTMSEGVLVVNAKGVLRYANAAADRLTGRNLSASKGKKVVGLLADWDWPHLLAQPDDEDWVRCVTREIEVAYPERKILELKSRPCDGQTVALFLRDVTRDRAREASALESERTDAIKELASGVAHEIGNPLNALGINLDLLAREFRGEPDPARRERLLADVATAREEVRRIDGINREFLAALRPLVPVLAPGNLADALNRTLQEFRAQFEERGVRVLVDLPPALPLVAFDARQIGQVFFNLVKNALEAMKDGGRLSVELSVDDQSVNASFRDSGAGLSREALDRLFEPYRTTKASGNGLGLMICRRIVHAHGGELDVESKEGEGTRFTVRLPRLEKRVRALGVQDREERSRVRRAGDDIRL